MSSPIMILHVPLLPLLRLLLQIQLAVVYSQLLPSAGAYTNHTSIPAVPCLPDQASALLRLRRSFSITNYSTVTFRSWRAGADCCHWEGIRCGDANGRVTSLNLGGRRLKSGALDPALFHLTSLKYLNLAYNNFNGSQLPPTGFERLTKLTYLNLSSSDFAGPVPTAGISSLTNLVLLDLSTSFEVVDLLNDGRFTYLDSSSDSIQLVEPNFETLIANHSNLRELHLGWVDLSTNGLQWCDALAKSSPKLRVLSLPYCGLSGPICESLSGLHSLAVIDLQLNSLSGPIPDFTNFPGLIVLQLRHNKLEGSVSSLLFKHKKLVTIDIYNNHDISGYLPDFSADSSLENLFVGGTNFSGKIPNSIGNLESLKKLGLGATGFSGKLPSSIGNLKSLNLLEISGRAIVGSIPLWITNLTSLTTLQFSDCGLSGSIPSFVGDLRKLRKLALCNCSFSGKIPSYISNFTQLQTLLLYSNNFIGTVELSSLWGLQHLRHLDVSDNNLVVVDVEDNSSLIHFPKMELLSLRGCNMSKFPNFLRHQDKITYLDLSNNHIHGAIPQWAWESWNNGIDFLNLANNKFTSFGYSPFLPFQMEWLDLSNNMFEGPIPIPRGPVRWLDYSSNGFSSIPFNFIAHLSDVALFNAHGNNFSGEIPPSFCSATSLQILDLSNNNFNGSVPSCLMENVNGLNVLNLKANQLRGEFPDNIKEGCPFQALDFSDNWIEGQLPRSLVACKNLEVLDVGNNQISDSFPCWMSTLHRLQVLVLRSNKFFGQVAQSLAGENSTCAFPSAIIVDISSNNFSGRLPQDQWFKKLKSMVFRDSNMSLVLGQKVSRAGRTIYQYTAAVTYKGHDTTFAKILGTLVFIDVSNNAFHGSIPKAIGELVLLHGLNMSHNSLTGTIPPQLGRLNQLEALDLSSNELSGVIPQELAPMDFLAVLNLSYNKLEGRIPESRHFLTFSNSSFLGNDGLCGPPLSKGCSNITTLNVVPHPSKKNPADIMLFLLAGSGFGIGFAIVIVVTWGFRIRKRS